MPAHWSDAYVRAGLKYEAGVFECAALVEQIRREVFKHDVHLPRDSSAAASVRGALIRHHLPDYCAPADAPADGDGVLLRARGRPQHVGLYCDIAGEGWVIHNIEIWNVTRMRLRDLPRWHIGIEGFYKWI